MNSPPALAASTARKAPGAMPRTAICRATPSRRARSIRRSRCTCTFQPDGEKTVYMVHDRRQDPRRIASSCTSGSSKMAPQGVIDRTTAYWRLWVGGTNINFGNLPPKVVDLFKRSLLVVRTQIDNGGAIIAANDSDIMQFSRDTYSYMWPRDGALVADALDLAGFPDLARWFYTFCSQGRSPRMDTSITSTTPMVRPASSWHPWVLKGKWPCRSRKMRRRWSSGRCGGITTAIATSNSSGRCGSISSRKPPISWCRYRDPRTGLPLPSYDLWEERWGVHAFTVATVYGGLKAAQEFRRLLRRSRKGRASTTRPPRKSKPAPPNISGATSSTDSSAGSCPSDNPSPPDRYRDISNSGSNETVRTQ